MMSNVNLAELTFGHDYAERDAKQGFLSKVFLKTPLYNRIKNDQCELVIGRKGAGKSANCLILKGAFESEGTKVALLTPESLSKQKIQALEISSINREETYLQTWRYVLLTKISFDFINLLDRLEVPNNKYLKSIRSFLKEQGEVEKDFGESLSGLLRERLKRVTGSVVRLRQSS
jgi:energy-coupling factor transporter ATP-binding protein EcfA2